MRRATVGDDHEITLSSLCAARVRKVNTSDTTWNVADVRKLLISSSFLRENCSTISLSLKRAVGRQFLDAVIVEPAFMNLCFVVCLLLIVCQLFDFLLRDGGYVGRGGGEMIMDAFRGEFCFGCDQQLNLKPS